MTTNKAIEPFERLLVHDRPRKSAAHDTFFSSLSNTLRYESTQLDSKKKL